MAQNIVDSSAWLAFFADEAAAGQFAEPIEATETLIVPTICIYEVFKRTLLQQGEAAARRAVVQMRLGHVVDLDAELALDAVLLSVEHQLPMADSIILATARRFGAVLWTQDADFEGLAGVRYFPKLS